MVEYNINKALEILKQTPKTLSTFLSNLSDEWIYCNEGGETWSAYDIIGHLIHGEKTDWTSRLKLMYYEGEIQTFTPFDRFAQFENSKGKTLKQLLEEFTELRKRNIDFVLSLNITKLDFDKKAIHPDLGEVSLKQLLATWTVHDLGHIAQISRIMAKQYKHEVGPWKKYLSILNK